MTRIPAFAAGFVVLLFGTAVRAQAGEALRAEVLHELSRPLAADTAGLEAQVRRLQALLQKTSGLAGGAGAASVPAAPLKTSPPPVASPGVPPTAPPSLPAIFAAAGAASRPSAAGAASSAAAPVAGERANPVVRMRQLLHADAPGGGDPTRPDLVNAKGFVYQPSVAVGGDQANHQPHDARAHMTGAFQRPKTAAGGTGLQRSFPQGGRNSLYGASGGGGDPRFSNGSYGGYSVNGGR